MCSGLGSSYCWRFGSPCKYFSQCPPGCTAAIRWKSFDNVTSCYQNKSLIICGMWLQAFILEAGEPSQTSGKQEHFEALLNHYIWSLTILTQYIQWNMHVQSFPCFVLWLHDGSRPIHVIIHILQGFFNGTGAIIRLPQCQWRYP